MRKKAVWSAGAVCRLGWAALLLIAGTLSATAAGAQGAVPEPQQVPALRVLEETTAVRVRDDRKALVTLRVPNALHRPANAFRLYGARPLTMQNRDRRRDLYRDAFLELATRQQLSPSRNAWDSLGKQWEWLSAGRAGSKLGPPPSADTADSAALARAVAEASRRLAAVPGYPHLQTLQRALGNGPLGTPEFLEPVAAALQLRAVATDEAERRLTLLGQALRVDAPGTDPALRAGFAAARSEFTQVRQGLWSAISASVKRQGGQLLLSGVKNLVLSRLGHWAIFGYLGLQGVEGALNTEYRGQYAIALATLAAGLSEAAQKPEAADGGSTVYPLALYAEYTLNYQVTETLKSGQLMPLKAAGGRSESGWQIECGGRCAILRQALVSVQ